MRIMLLMIAFAIFSCKNITSSFAKTYRGNINDIGVVMQLQKNGTEITGSYYYIKKGIPIKVKGEVSLDGTVTLKELNGGEVTGLFKGEFVSNSFSGTWSTPSGTREYDFLLVENDEIYSPRDEVPAVSAPTESDRAPIPIPDELVIEGFLGEWNVFLECQASECDFSTPGERVAERWSISRSSTGGLTINVSGSKHKIRSYTVFDLDDDHSEVDIEVKNIGVFSKYSGGKGRLSIDGGLHGTLVLGTGKCASKWTIAAQETTPTVKFTQ